MKYRALRLALAALLAAVSSGRLLAEEEYKVGKQDVLRIDVPGEMELSRESVTVSPAGSINLPFIGELKVEGLNTTQISDLIRGILVEKKILNQPLVTVTVREYRSQPVTVLGEVRTTGKYYLRSTEKLLDKIAEAGGLTANAGDITLSRSKAGGVEMITVKSENLLSDATLLQPGDVVLVKTREVKQVYVSGEVVSGRPITHVEGLTLSQAILIAGGLTRFGSKSKITVKRTVNGEEVLIRANLADIERGKTKDILLLPNDAVVVGRRIF